MMCAIASGFAGICLFQVNPLLACLYWFTFFQPIAAYIAMFQLAFKVTEGGEAVKREALRLASRVFLHSEKANPSSHSRSLSRERECVMRILRKSLKLAMSVGGFHTVKRETIPIFASFIIEQIVGLLVTFSLLSAGVHFQLTSYYVRPQRKYCKKGLTSLIQNYINAPFPSQFQMEKLWRIVDAMNELLEQMSWLEMKDNCLKCNPKECHHILVSLMEMGAVFSILSCCKIIDSNKAT
jgi:hypothetical protein